MGFVFETTALPLRRWTIPSAWYRGIPVLTERRSVERRVSPGSADACSKDLRGNSLAKDGEG
jgi:hypothetical protein